MSERDPMNVEQEMLREFYGAWRDLHAIPRDRVHRTKQELAAQRLVEAHHTLRNFYLMHPEDNPAQEQPRLEVVRG